MVEHIDDFSSSSSSLVLEAFTATRSPKTSSISTGSEERGERRGEGSNLIDNVGFEETELAEEKVGSSAGHGVFEVSSAGRGGNGRVGLFLTASAALSRARLRRFFKFFPFEELDRFERIERPEELLANEEALARRRPE